MAFTRGRLAPPDEAPGAGESVRRLALVGDSAVDQILSGPLDEPVDYRATESEWVVVLHGRAELHVEGQRLFLEPGDWVHLPPDTAHRLVETASGTSWLTVTSPAPVASSAPAGDTSAR